MPSIGSIFVDLRLNDALFTQGVGRARNSTKQFSNAAQNDLQKAARAFQNLVNPVNLAGGAIRQIALTAAGAFSVQKVIQYSDSYKQLQGRLSLVTKNTEELAGVQEELFQISQETRSDFGATVTLYQRLTSATKGLSVSQAEVLKFTEQLNKQLVVAGVTGEEARSVILQLTQAFNKGKLDGDEFRTILEAAPPILEALSTSLNKTRGEILQMARDGKLGPRELINAVNDMAAVTDERFSKFSLTVEQAFTNLDGAFLKFIGNSKAVTDGSNAIAESINFIARNLQEVAPLVNGFSDTIKLAFMGLEGTFRVILVAVLQLNSVVQEVLYNLSYIPNRIQSLFSDKADQTLDYMKKIREAARQSAYDAGTGLNEFNKRIGQQDFFTARPEQKPFEPSNEKPKASNVVLPDPKKIKEINDLYKQNRQYLMSIDSATLKYQDTLKEFKQLLDSGKISYEDYNRAIGNLNKEFENAQNSAKKFSDETSDFARKAAENIQDAFADFLFDPFKDGIDGMLKGWVDVLRKMAANAAAAQLGKTLFGDFSNGRSGGDGLFSDLLGGLGNLFGGSGGGGINASDINWNSVPKFATGIDRVPYDMPAIIHQDEAVLNKQEASAWRNGGSGGNTYNIDARGADQAAVARLEKALLVAAGPGVIEKRVMNAQQRGSL